VKLLGEGWVGEEVLAVGVYAALAGQSFREVFATAANHDGDSDSTASIAGQLRGAWRGIADLPQSWIEQLDVFDPAMRLVTELLKRGSDQLGRDA
jgi:ADP-ribosylglycohydrolase